MSKFQGPRNGHGRWYCYQRPLRLKMEVLCPKAFLSGFRRPDHQRSQRTARSPNCCWFPPGVGICGEASTRTWRMFSCSDLLFLLSLLALRQRSDQVSGISASVSPLSRRSALSGGHRCLTITSSHSEPSRTTEKTRLIHRWGALRWIKGRTKKAILLARNFRIQARINRTYEDGLHAVHEGRSY